MPGEIGLSLITGKTIYANIIDRISGGMYWNTSGGFEVYSELSGSQLSYAIPLTEQGTGGHYVGDAPPTLPPGGYDVIAKLKGGAFFAPGDDNIGGGELQWSSPNQSGGTGVIPWISFATSGQLGAIGKIQLNRQTMVENFKIYLKSASDHSTPFTSGACSGQIVRDAGTVFGPLQSGAFTEIGNGFYNLQALTSGDLDAETAALLFTAARSGGFLSDPLPFAVVLQGG